MLTTEYKLFIPQLTLELADRWLKENKWQPIGISETGKALEYRKQYLPPFFDRPDWGYVGFLDQEYPGINRDAYNAVHFIERLAIIEDRWPDEILLEMIYPGCVIERSVWFRYENRQPEIGQQVNLKPWPNDLHERYVAQHLGREMDAWLQKQMGWFPIQPNDLWRPAKEEK